MPYTASVGGICVVALVCCVRGMRVVAGVGLSVLLDQVTSVTLVDRLAVWLV